MNELIVFKEGNFRPIPDKHETSFCLTTPQEPKGLLVLSHGAGAGMSHPNIESITSAMDQIGIAVFRYNFLYMQAGKGRESSKVSIQTVKEAVTFAHSLLPSLPVFVGGHSYGGRMSSHAAVADFEVDVRGMIYFAFPLHAPGRPGDERGQHLREIKLPQLFLCGSRDPFSSGTLLENLLAPIGSTAHLHRLDTASHSYKILKRSRQREDSVFEEMASVASPWLDSL